MKLGQCLRVSDEGTRVLYIPLIPILVLFIPLMNDLVTFNVNLSLYDTLIQFIVFSIPIFSCRFVLFLCILLYNASHIFVYTSSCLNPSHWLLFCHVMFFVLNNSVINNVQITNHMIL